MISAVEKRIFIFLSLLFVAANVLFIYNDNLYFNLVPFALLAIWMALFSVETLFWIVIFCVPLSLNTDEFTKMPVAFYLPTEPILFGLLIVFVLNQYYQRTIDLAIFKHPIFIAYALYLLWVGVCVLTSMNPVVSLKFLLARLWLFVPVFFMGTHLFRNIENIKKFLWLYIIGLSLVVIYTVTQHAAHGFEEKPAHWVMSPFFRDHTSYGAILAIYFVIAIGLYFNKAYTPLRKSVIAFIILVLGAGLFFSYTRAAWLSVAGALGIWIIIRLKIKFSTILVVSIAGLILFFSAYDQIIMTLQKNDTDSSDDIGKHLESMSNISTDASNLERLNRWDCALQMFQEKPVFGWGPGTYQFYYAPFQRAENITIISTYNGDLGNAHSEYLGPLAETGLIGMLLFISVVVVIFYRGFRAYHKLPPGELRLLLLICLLGLSTYFIHGVLNNYLDTDKAAVPVWGICAVIAAVDIYHLKKEDSASME